jgi:single-strand DNA-binding protein
MPDRNEVILVGTLAYDPDLKYISSGDAVCNAKIKTVRELGTRTFSDYNRVVAWREAAEVLGQGKKGKRVDVRGHLKTRSYEDREGVKRWITEVEVEHVRVEGVKEQTPPESEQW